MRKRKLIIFNILVCFMISLSFFFIDYHETHDLNSVNVVTERKEKESQELEIVPIEIKGNQDIDKYDKIKAEKETDEDMKKEFETPTVEIVEFDNEDVITTSNELPDAPVGGH